MSLRSTHQLLGVVAWRISGHCGGIFHGAFFNIAISAAGRARRRDNPSEDYIQLAKYQARSRFHLKNSV
eukprot:scaffold3483_cov115-Skeletonema_dohrnii-CCMP3373.AAC.3